MLKKSNVFAILVVFVSTISFLLTSCNQPSSSTTSLSLTTGSVASISNSSNISSATGTITKVVASTPSSVMGSTTKVVASTQPLVIPAASTVEEIADKSIITVAKLQSFKFNMDFTMSSDFSFGTQTGTMTIQQTATGSVDITNKQVATNANVVLQIPGQAQQNATAEIYILNGWIYTGTTPTVGTEQWSKMALTDEMWSAESQISSMSDFLTNHINLELVGTEIVNGVDCYIFSINPDMKSLISWIEGQMQSEQANVNLNDADFSQMLKDFTVKEWVAKDSYLPIKQQIGVTLNIPSIQTTSSTPGTPMSMYMNATLTYSDYGQHVNVQLPPEALNAKEITLPQ